MTSEQRADLLALYGEVDAEIAAENPRCDVSGRCCRFSEYGHTLFLSAVEAELLFERSPEPEGGECLYQIAGRCTARERRPLGCRIYFCDPSYAERMAEISEFSIRQLKALHDRWGRAWDYRPLERFTAEWRSRQSTVPGADRSLPILACDPCQLDSSLCGD